MNSVTQFEMVEMNKNWKKREIIAVCSHWSHVFHEDSKE